MNDEILNEYNRINIQLKLLMDKQKEIRDGILGDMVGSGAEKIQVDFGTFSVVKRVNHEFDLNTKTEINTLKKEIRIVEARAIKAGNTKVETNDSLRFVPKKVTL